MKKNKYELLIILCVFVLCVVTSIGYSSFGTTLSISGDAFVRVDSDIRITNLELVSLNGGAVEKYDSEFSKDLTSVFVRLPNTNSSAVYRVTVANTTGSYYSPNEISAIVNSNGNVSYSLTGIESYGVYSGESMTFNITLTTSLANQDIALTLKYDFAKVTGRTWTFTMTGGEQEFIAPYKANYKMEAWGAQGGNDGGKGGYTSGEISLNAKTKMFVYVGGKGIAEGSSGVYDVVGGYNGGGSTTNQKYGGRVFSSGGGSTDIRLVNGAWNNFSSLKSRIMVAAGGGGKFGSEYPTQFVSTIGHGGGLNGLDCIISSTPYGLAWGENTIGASQTAGGYCLGGTQFGYSKDQHSAIGKFGIGSDSANYGTGGGGGYYGGGGSLHVQNASGGSSFISGYTGCNAIAESSTENNIVHLGSPNHYSGYIFKNMSLIAGDSEMPTHDGAGKMIGNSGDGYFKITLILN